jgi:hypothetical protein
MTKKKNLNALTHGGFVDALILPNEDPEEFKELHETVKREWNPDGPSENDKVLSVATNMWRKRRVRRYMQEHIDDLEWKATLRRRRLERESDRLLKFLEDYEAGILGPITEEDLSDKLGAKWAYRIKASVPRSKFETDSAWLDKVTGFIVMAPTEEALDVQKFFSSEALPNCELAFEERIDAKIAKDLKELGQMKTMKTIVLGKSPASVRGEKLKAVDSPSIQPTQK